MYLLAAAPTKADSARARRNREESEIRAATERAQTRRLMTVAGAAGVLLLLGVVFAARGRAKPKPKSRTRS